MTTEVSRGKRLVDRRAFLKAAATGLALGSLDQKAFAQLRVAPPTTDQCPVGYLDGHECLSSNTGECALSGRRVVPAQRIGHAGSPFPDRSLLLHFHGIRLPETRPTYRLCRLLLDLEMHVLGEGVQNVPWHFWTYSNDGVLNVSGDVIARVPLRDDGSLMFTMAVESTPDTVRTKQIALSDGSNPDCPILVPGTYFIAVPEDEFEFPSAWRLMRWKDPADSTTAFERSPIDQFTAPFAFLSFAVSDHAERETDCVARSCAT